MLSEHVESATHICVLLAAIPEGDGLSTKRLAEFHSLPAPSLAKQLQQLARAGIVVGSTGRFGGYRLARSAEDISVLDIVRAVDEAAVRFQCREIRRRGPCTGPNRKYNTQCAVARVVNDAADAWRAALLRVSLADLTSQIGEQLDPTTRAETRVWCLSNKREIQ